MEREKQLNRCLYTSLILLLWDYKKDHDVGFKVFINSHAISMYTFMDLHNVTLLTKDHFDSNRNLDIFIKKID